MEKEIIAENRPISGVQLNRLQTLYARSLCAHTVASVADTLPRQHIFVADDKKKDRHAEKR